MLKVVSNWQLTRNALLTVRLPACFRIWGKTHLVQYKVSAWAKENYSSSQQLPKLQDKSQTILLEEPQEQLPLPKRSSRSIRKHTKRKILKGYFFCSP